MDYQLVLQFRGDSLADLDAAIELEDELADALGEDGDVDGHDVGSGEINLFIFTSDPAAAFSLSKPVIEKAGCLKSVTAAYREVDGDDYTVIWPTGSKRKFKVS